MQQDNQIKTLQDNLNKLIENAPAGFLPQTYYGLVEGETQTYRADQQTIENVALPSTPAFGKVYALTSPTETEGYVPTYIAFVSGSQTQNTCEIIIKGDYNKAPTLFDIVDMSTGEVANSQTITGLSFSQQAASYVGEYSPHDNYNHQITALHDVSFNEDNVVYASIDVNSDGVYNWVKIGNYRNGGSGKSVKTVTAATMASVLQTALIGDTLLAGETFSGDNYEFNIGDLKTITELSPLTLQDNGNIRGAQGATGATGATGADGTTPSIVDGYWYLGTTNTNVKAEGKDGQNGVDGNSFSIQTPLYSAPNNVGVPNNVDPQGNALTTLPTLPQTDISGKAYVVYDPLTTPLTPFYDLYYANNNDTEWTIIHPYTGLAGKNGVDGLTPSIQNGYWYIGNENTGVNARGLQGPQGIQGPQGPQGPQGDPGVGFNFMLRRYVSNESPAIGVVINITSTNTTYDKLFTNPVSIGDPVALIYVYAEKTTSQPKPYRYISYFSTGTITGMTPTKFPPDLPPEMQEDAIEYQITLNANVLIASDEGLAIYNTLTGSGLYQFANRPYVMPLKLIASLPAISGTPTQIDNDISTNTTSVNQEENYQYFGAHEWNILIIDYGSDYLSGISLESGAKFSTSFNFSENTLNVYQYSTEYSNNHIKSSIFQGNLSSINATFKLCWKYIQ